jgi:hypothetical protein
MVDSSIRWKVDECSAYFDRLRLRGWCFGTDTPVRQIEARMRGGALVSLPECHLHSPDVAAVFGPAAAHCRFDAWLPLPPPGDFTLRVTFADGQSTETSSVYDNARVGDAGHFCWRRFLASLDQLPSGRVIEIGARARSGIVRRDQIPAHLDYVGFDLLPGPNVDLVGDAHRLSELVPPDSVAAVFSLSVFEHLAMPWKVVLELNRVLVCGGLVFVNTPQTWPLHDEPWDFWRFSRHCWTTLFNAATGFEIVECADGEPARVHPIWDAPVVRDMPLSPAFLSSNVIARKVSNTRLSWPVPTEVATTGTYPSGESCVSQ